MKNTGILMIFFSIMAFLPGLFLVFNQPDMTSYSGEKRRAERDLEMCQLEMLLTPGTFCDREEAKVSQITRAQPAKNPADYLWGYAILSAAPFFILIGTVLFAAGKVEDTVKALGQHAGTQAP